LSRVKSRVPRGFTRYYVLHLLSERPMTGKEIIDEAEGRSEGGWSPSPGLIYPLLGRLAGDGLVSEVEGGRFAITPNGREALTHYTELQEQIEKQLEVVSKLGLQMITAGRFVVDEAVDRISWITRTVKRRAERSSKEMQKKFNDVYREFLESELEKLREDDEYEEALPAEPRRSLSSGF
jgi:DNA-binding PadR family transcriptional regulator